MKHPQIVVFENDGVLAQFLAQLLATERADAAPPRWLLRETRQVPACLNLLRAGGPSVLVLKVGRNLQRELSVLDDVHAALPDVPVVVVADSEDEALEVLAYELGAVYVLQPPQPRHHLVEVVEHLVKATIDRMKSDSVRQSDEDLTAHA